MSDTPTDRNGQSSLARLSRPSSAHIRPGSALSRPGSALSRADSAPQSGRPTPSGSTSRASSSFEHASSNIQVCVRVRPFIIEAVGARQGSNCVDVASPSVFIGKSCFTFDHVFGPEASQEDVYEECVAPLVEATFDGVNGTLLAYGQTGSGKTYTMGTSGLPSVQQGALPRAIHRIFTTASERSEIGTTNFRVSFAEIFTDSQRRGNVEEIRDLLTPGRAQVFATIKTDLDGQPRLEGVEEHEVWTEQEALALLNLGSASRATASTRMNDSSSRSHAIFSLEVIQRRMVSGVPSTLTARFQFVDLAGSEKIKVSGVEGDQLFQAININHGLFVLGKVITALTEGHPHIPFRESKLTRILQNSLGGNSRTCMVACVSPSDSNLAETVSTLTYAAKAKEIKNKPVVNRGLSCPSCQVLQAKLDALESAKSSNVIAGPPTPTSTHGKLRQERFHAYDRQECEQMANQKLESERNLMEEQMEKMRKRCEELTVQVEKSLQTADSDKAQRHKTLQEKASSLRDEHDQLKDHHSSIKGSEDSKSKELLQMIDKLEKEKQQSKEWRALIIEEQNRNRDLQEELSKISKERTDAIKSEKSARKLMEKIQSENGVRALEDEIKSLQTQLARRQELYGRAEKEQQERTKECIELKKELEALQTGSGISQDTIELRKKLTKSEERIQELMLAAASNATQGTEELKSQLAESKKQIEELKAANNPPQSSDELKRELAESNKWIEELNELKEQLSEINKQIEELKAERESLQEKLTNATDCLRELMEEKANSTTPEERAETDEKTPADQEQLEAIQKSEGEARSALEDANGKFEEEQRVRKQTQELQEKLAFSQKAEKDARSCVEAEAAKAKEADFCCLCMEQVAAIEKSLEEVRQDLEEEMRQALEEEMRQALEVLSRLAEEGDSEVVSRLLVLLDTDRDFRVRWAATEALGRLAVRGDSRVLTALLARLDDEADSVWKIAAQALGHVTFAPLQELEVQDGEPVSGSYGGA